MQINSVLSVLIIALTVILIIAFTKKPSSWWNIPLLAPIRVRGLPIILSYFTKGYDVLPVQNAAYKNYRYRFILTTLPSIKLVLMFHLPSLA